MLCARVRARARAPLRQELTLASFQGVFGSSLLLSFALVPHSFPPVLPNMAEALVRRRRVARAGSGFGSWNGCGGSGSAFGFGKHGSDGSCFRFGS